MFSEKKKIFETSFLFRGVSFYGAGCTVGVIFGLSKFKSLAVFWWFFLKSNIRPCFISKETFLTLFLWFYWQFAPPKITFFLLKFRSLLRGLWALVAFLIPFPSWTLFLWRWFNNSNIKGNILNNHEKLLNNRTFLCGVTFFMANTVLNSSSSLYNLNWTLTLIRVAIKKSVAGRLKVIYDPHIVQWQAGFLCGVRCLCVCLTHRSSQRPEEVDSLCVPVRGTWKWNIANPKTVPESWEPQDSGTFGFAIFHF